MYKKEYINFCIIVLYKGVKFMDWSGGAFGVSLLSLVISFYTYMENRKAKKLKARPIFFISSTFENRHERYIEFYISVLKSQDLREFDLMWTGDPNVKLNFKKILKNEEKNIWEYKAILDIKNTVLENEVNGKLIIECTTIYEDCLVYYKEIKIISKYYQSFEEYFQELVKVASTEFIEY